MNKIGISLGGGGVRAILELGVLEALSEIGITPSIISGVSGGAVVASLYACGFKPRDILNISENINLFSLLQPKSILFNQEIIDHSKFEQVLRGYIKNSSFKGTNLPLIIFATDFEKRIPEIITKGDIVSAVLASCALAPIIRPYRREGKLLVDGGYSVKYGAKYLREFGAKKVLAVEVSDGLHPFGAISVLTELVQSYEITEKLFKEYEQKLYPCDYILNEFNDSTFLLKLDADKNKLFDTGYKHTMSKKDEILKKLNTGFFSFLGF